MKRSTWIASACVLMLGTTLPAATPPEGALRVARYDQAGNLARPADLDRWVFLGASLGMNYDDTSFSVEHPGAFQVVLMEPTAYEYFIKHGRYADGSMFLLSFYETLRGTSIDRAGFVPGALNNFEIHVIDRARQPDGRAFYTFGRNSRDAAPLPAGNACVQCHIPRGAYDGTFTQFYPPIRELVPVKATAPPAPDPSIK